MKYTEANFQDGRIVGFFTQSLNWKEGLREEIDKENFIIPSDVAWFLKEGNNSNKRSFNNLIKSYGSDDKLVDAFKVLYFKATSGVSKIRLNKITKLYSTLDASFKTKMSLIESDYESWVLGESGLNNK